MSQIMELKMCDLTPTCLSSDSGSYQQFPNPEGEASIKEPLSPNKGSVLKNMAEWFFCFLFLVMQSFWVNNV